MIRIPADDPYRRLTERYVASIDSPQFDLAGIRARRPAASTAKGAPSRVRRLIAALAVAGCTAAAVPHMPAVVAQVERTLRAFTVLDGHTVPLNIREVSLARARADVSFTVIAPAAIPAGWHLTIRELSSTTSPAQAQLLFEFRNAGPGLGFTIVETARNAPERPIMITQSKGGMAPPAAPPLPPASGLVRGESRGQIQVKGPHGAQFIRFKPVTWDEDGTRIAIMSPPDALSAAQLARIRAAMSAEH
jgi:hypothetical protein